MPAAPNDNQKSDIEWLLILVAVLVAGVCYLVYTFVPQVPFYGVLTLGYLETKFLNIFGWGDPAVTERIEGFVTGHFDLHDLPATEFADLYARLSEASRWFSMAAILGIAAYLYRNMKGGDFTKAYNLNSLIEYQSTYFEQLAPSAKFQANTDDEVLAPQLKPFEWLIKHGIEAKGGAVDEEACAEAFKAQLGPEWTGVESASQHVQALVLMAGYHGISTIKNKVSVPHLGKIQVSERLRQELAGAYTYKQGEERDAEVKRILEPLLKNKKLLAKIEEMTANHAYASTALIALFTWARKTSGVFATSEMMWIKPVDRALFYALNNVGRSGAYHVEGGGPIAHFDAERVARRKLSEPRVEKAVWGVSTYLEDRAIDPDEWTRKQALMLG